MEYESMRKNFFNYISESSDIELPKKSKGYNLDRWGKTDSTNTLYITGMSGAGKSVLAKSLEKDGVDVIHLDSYFDNPDGPSSKAFDKHLRKFLPGYKKMRLPKDKIDMVSWGEVVKEFEKELINFSVAEYKSGKKVIVEGVHLLDDTLYPDKSFFIGKPLIILDVGILKSIHQANERDDSHFRLSDIKDRRYWRKDIRNLMEVLKQ